jgi:hypothetical protein
MGLLDDFDAEASSLEVGRCPVRKYLNGLPPDKRPDIEAILLSDRQAAKVVPWLEARLGPLPFDDKGLLAHRRRLTGRNGCRCPIS